MSKPTNPQPAPSPSTPSPEPPNPALLFSLLPSPWIPYAELTRLHKPTGIIVIYLPYLLGLLLATILSPASPPAPLRATLSSASTLFFTSVIHRSAGCTWNDVIDHELDRTVSRCRTRPIARGAVSPIHGAIFFGLQATAWLTTLCFLIATPTVFVVAVPVFISTMLYPYGKRVTDYPQLILGLTLASGMFIGGALVSSDNNNVEEILALVRADARAAGGFGCLFLAYVAWTGVYDTIYGFQDLQDDLQSGVRSMAVRWRHRGKLVLATMALVQLSLLALTGYAIEAGRGYYLTSCGASAAALAIMLWRIDLGSAEECAWWFKHGTLAVGASMTLGLVQELMRR